MVPRNFFAGDFRIDCCYRDVKPSGFVDIVGAAGSQHGPNRFTERRMARAVAVLTVAGAASCAPTAERLRGRRRAFMLHRGNVEKIFRPWHEIALAIQFHREADLFRAVSTVVPPYYGVA
jgi:hypothetical protein